MGHIIFAIVIVLILCCIFYRRKSEVEVPKEKMIAASTIGRFSRGYNGLNTGGGYDDAMRQLHEAENMNLQNVETDARTL
jgi:hypothetical protein